MLTRTGHSRKTRNLSKKCYIRHCQTSRHLHRAASCYFPPIPRCAGINDLNDTVLGYQVIAEAFPKERFPSWRLAGDAAGRWGSHRARLSVPAQLGLLPFGRAKRSRPAALLPPCHPRAAAPALPARSSGTRDPGEEGAEGVRRRASVSGAARGAQEPPSAGGTSRFVPGSDTRASAGASLQFRL